jgi:chromosome segregation ATPase
VSGHDSGTTYPAAGSPPRWAEAQQAVREALRRQERHLDRMDEGLRTIEREGGERAAELRGLRADVDDLRAQISRLRHDHAQTRTAVDVLTALRRDEDDEDDDQPPRRRRSRWRDRATTGAYGAGGAGVIWALAEFLRRLGGG